MSQRRWGALLLVLVAQGSATASDDPPIPAGRSDVVFKESAPEASSNELKRRLGATRTPPSYDVAKEKFRVLVPESYRPDAEGWGLFVWVDASPEPTLSPEWVPVLAEKKLIYVGAYNTGNTRDHFDRIRLAVDAAHNMKARFHVDTNRIYVSGASGGGQMSSILGVAYADVFAGSFPMIGISFYKDVPTGRKPNEFWLSRYRPVTSVLARAKARSRHVILTGESDFNRESMQDIFEDGYRAEGFLHVLYLEAPGLGHSRPPAEWLSKGLQFLDDEAPKDDERKTGEKKARPKGKRATL